MIRGDVLPLPRVVRCRFGDAALVVGDVVRHDNSMRRGSVTCVRDRGLSDGSVELDVVSREDGGRDHTQWNSAQITRVSPWELRGCPYRRYLAMCAVEDRAGHTLLPCVAWERVFWRLSNERVRDAYGEMAWVDLGRSHWERAALDCLDRRDTANRSRDVLSYSRASKESQ